MLPGAVACTRSKVPGSDVLPRRTKRLITSGRWVGDWLLYWLATAVHCIGRMQIRIASTTSRRRTIECVMHPQKGSNNAVLHPLFLIISVLATSIRHGVTRSCGEWACVDVTRMRREKQEIAHWRTKIAAAVVWERRLCAYGMPRVACALFTSGGLRHSRSARGARRALPKT